jgi:GGDEF domain-containing protein
VQSFSLAYIVMGKLLLLSDSGWMVYRKSRAEGGIGASDLVTHSGGEEFVILIPTASRCAARMAAGHLRPMIERFPWPLRPVTTSFGVATLGPEARDTAAFVEVADGAIYRSKQGPPIGVPVQVQVRLAGPDPATLRHQGDQAKELLRRFPGTTNIHDDWAPRSSSSA